MTARHRNSNLSHFPLEISGGWHCTGAILRINQAGLRCFLMFSFENLGDGELLHGKPVVYWNKSGWCFPIFFIFTAISGRFPFWLIFCKGVGSTTNQKSIAFRRSCLFNWWRFGGAERCPGDEFRDGAVPRPRVATGVGTGWPGVTQSGGGAGHVTRVRFGLPPLPGCAESQRGIFQWCSRCNKKMVKCFFVPSGAHRKKKILMFTSWIEGGMLVNYNPIRSLMTNKSVELDE